MTHSLQKESSPFIRQDRRFKALGETTPTSANAPTHLNISGAHFGAGYLVRIDDQPRCIYQSQFDYLLELSLAAYRSPKSPYLYWWDTNCTQGDPGLTRQIAKRLRSQIGRKSLIHNNHKGGYCLATDLASISICDTLWQLPPQLVAHEVLVALKVSYEEFWMLNSNLLTEVHDHRPFIVAQESRIDSVR